MSLRWSRTTEVTTTTGDVSGCSGKFGGPRARGLGVRKQLTFFAYRQQGLRASYVFGAHVGWFLLHGFKHQIYLELTILLVL